jgi:hypothetical protein
VLLALGPKGEDMAGFVAVKLLATEDAKGLAGLAAAASGAAGDAAAGAAAALVLATGAALLLLLPLLLVEGVLLPSLAGSSKLPNSFSYLSRMSTSLPRKSFRSRCTRRLT